jgi:hypothetical protein
MITKQQILAATNLPIEPVDVPEWGGTVHVRTMSGTERDAFEQTMIALKAGGGKGATDLSNIRARLAVRTLCDADGTRLFIDDDAEALGQTSGRALDRVFGVAQRLNGMTAEDVKELVGN